MRRLCGAARPGLRLRRRFALRGSRAFPGLRRFAPGGLVRVRHNMPLYVLFCMQDTFVGQLRGVGYSLLPTITSLSGICLLRVVWLYTAFAASPTLDTLYLSYPVSWAATLFALVVCYAVVVRKMPREL